MSKSILEEKIDQLFEQQNGDSANELRTFVDQIRDQTQNAERSLRWYILVFLIIWGMGYLIGSGIVTEGEVAYFKIEKVLSLLIAWPLLLGGISYLLLASGSSLTLLISALNFAYKHQLPKLYEHDLDKFMLKALGSDLESRKHKVVII